MRIARYQKRSTPVTKVSFSRNGCQSVVPYGLCRQSIFPYGFNPYNELTSASIMSYNATCPISMR
jgi:hypothetical protein